MSEGGRELDLYSEAPGATPPPATPGRKELDLYDGVEEESNTPVDIATTGGRTGHSTAGQGASGGAGVHPRPEDWMDRLWRSFAPAMRERFEPLRVIGEGGMGVVIEAHDRVMDRIVAIKGPRDPRSISGKDRERQKREAQIAARLTHPNILPVYDLWTDARGNSWCSMLRVPGDNPTLAKRLAGLEGMPLTERPLICLLRGYLEICRAVSFAHKSGFLHRDLKPENIFMGQAQEGLLGDWGVAVELEAAKRGAAGDRVGTRGYAAPEQLGFLGEVHADERSDVYSLGIILYEIVVGRRFLRGSSVSSTISSSPEEAPPPPPIPELVPRELAAVIECSTAWNPEDRMPSADSMINAIDTYQMGGLLDGLEYGTGERVRKWAASHPLIAGVAITGLIAGVILAVFAWMLSHKTTWLAKRLAYVYAEKASTARQAHDTDRAVHYAAMALSTWPQQYVFPEPIPYTALAETGGRGRHLWARELSEPAACVAFSPGGEALAVGGAGGLIEIWDVKRAAKVRTLDGHSDTVLALAFSQNGLLASAGEDGLVRVWEPDGTPRPALKGHKGPVHSLGFSPDGTMVVTTGADDTVRRWRLDTAVAGLAPMRHQATVGAGSLAFDADANKVFLAARDGSMPMLDLRTENFVGHIAPCRGGIRLITYIPGRGPTPRRLVAFTGTEPDTATCVRLWDLTFWREFGALHHDRRVTALHLTPDLRTLVSGTEDGAIRVWDIDNRKVEIELTGHRKTVNAIAISADARLLASVGQDRSVRVWDMQTGAQRDGFSRPIDGRSEYAFAPDGRHVRELPRDGGDARIWESVSRTAVATEPLGGAALDGPAVTSPDGERLLARSGKRLMMWDMRQTPGMKLIGVVPLHGDVRAYGFTRAGRLLIGTATPSSLRVFDAGAGETVTELFWPHVKPRHARVAPRPSLIALGADARMAAAADADGKLWVWEPKIQGRDAELVGVDHVTALAFNPRGDTLAVGRRDGSVVLWQPRRPRNIRLDAHRTPVASLAFSADGEQLVTTASEPVARLWDLAAYHDPDALLRRLRFTSPFEADGDMVLVPKRNLAPVPPWFPPDYRFGEAGK